MLEPFAGATELEVSRASGWGIALLALSSLELRDDRKTKSNWYLSHL